MQNITFLSSEFKDNIAVITHSSSFTYGDLENISKTIVSKIPKRCLVFNLASNVIGALAGYLAFLNNNIVQLLLADKLDSKLLMDLVEKYHPSYLWLPKELSDECNYPSIFEYFGYVLLQTNLKPYPISEELCFLLPTSGSTGSPKLVRHSYHNLISSAESLSQCFDVTVNERPITTLPMNYTMGLSVINSHLIKGATILLTDKSVIDKAFWEFFKKEGATSICGVPFTFEMLHTLRFSRMDLPTLKSLSQGGGKLSEKLQKEFAEYANKYGKKLYWRYGQTESTATTAYTPYNKSMEKCGSIGIAVPNGKFSLRDSDGEIITVPNVPGELIYQGPNVTMGYAECGDDLIKGDERHGILETGDIAIFDSDGYYYILGRIKRFLKIFGLRVSLDECEQLIKAEFNIPCACVGRDELMIIYITDQAKIRDIEKFITEKTRINRVGFKIKYIDELPRNDSGKIMYSALQNE